MKRVLLPLLCILPACALLQKPPRPVHAPPEEAAAVAIPLAFPTEGRQVINGTTLRAIQLAMEDFLPWDRKLPSDATPLYECLNRRESYVVATAPASPSVVLVSILPNPDACDIATAPILDVGATYAVDVNGWRILAVQE
ncbi:hypothetical protein [Comamonas sp. JC664]|uniref:hypothetical protein n=1 Tax=Comamonas sp. JC664 TaxID=2801917 RepID=UPI00174C3BA0|nr:hypothetical protein [Comamonas sp. JC664]MBL0692101.1 hypothetical protein [Comamonas sp. JC664]GHG99331.1 hypothetical protein GCM10012319_65600 [Comamonas sp. KCTC 72670]